MSTITPINQPTPITIPQRFVDLQMKKQLELSIEDSRKTTERLEHMLLEVNERLGLNKPDGDAA